MVLYGNFATFTFLTLNRYPDNDFDNATSPLHCYKKYQRTMKNTNATEYRTVFNRDVSKFDQEVNNLLSEGWALYGSPYSMGSGDESCQFQAMTFQALTKSRDGEAVQGDLTAGTDRWD